MTVNKNLFFAASITVISTLLAAQSFSYPAESAVFPRFLCILMVFFSILILIKTLKNNVQKQEDGGSIIQTFKLPVLVFGLTALYIIAIQHIGYFVSTVAFMAFTMFFFGERRFLPSAAAILIFLGVVYALFISFLGLRLPEGLLF
ncbi:MAG: tripartite tricarboxylate transporter TctB family protein [Cloacibacillus sp.]